MAKSSLAVKRKATLSAYEPSLREKAAILGEKGFKAVTGREPGYEARENINRYTGLLDLLEVPGAVLSANDAARNLKSKQYGAAAGDIAGLAAGAIPIAGGALKKGAKRVVKEGVEGAGRLIEKYVKPTGALADVRPPTDDVNEVLNANFRSGKIVGNQTVPTSILIGGTTSDQADRIKKLADEMSSQNGYFSRIIVDQDNNVVEGQHRLEAARLLGLPDIPIVRIKDIEAGLPTSQMEEAIVKSAPTRSDNVNQLIGQLAEIYSTENSVAKIRREYDAPKGFEAQWDAALKALERHETVGGDASRLLTKYPEARSVRPSEVAIDPRIEERKGELGKISALKVHEAPRRMEPTPEVSIFDMEGRPYITSMSDLSAAGKDIVGVNDVPLRDPFSLRGGQDWMFDNPGSVWASERKPAQKHVDLAKSLKDLTGKDPLFLPWTMGPNSVTFSHMPRGLQYEYANAAMDASDKAALASDIKSILPNWGSFEDPSSAKMFMSAEGSDRNALNKLMDKYRTRGGLGEGEAIYATTDLDQIGAPLTSLRNVGVITPEREVGVSTHPSYSGSVPGYGLGRLKEKNIGALALAPDVMQEAGITDPFDFPVGVVPGVKSPMRAYQMGPKGGILDYDTLRFIEQILAKDKTP